MVTDFLNTHGDVVWVEDLHELAAEWRLHNPNADTKLFTQNFVGFWDSWCEYADLWCAEHNCDKKINDAIALEAANEERAYTIRYNMLMEAINNAGICAIKDTPEGEETYCAVWRTTP